MKTSSAKAKGRKLQQWVRDFILLVYDLEFDDVKSTSMGASGEDLQLSPAARRVVPLSIECKSYAKMVLYQWYDQAVANCKKGHEPIVVAKANNRKPVVIVDAEYFFNMMADKKGEPDG